MTQIQAIRAEYDVFHANNEKVVVDLKAKLEEKQTEANAKNAEFVSYRKEIASAAENSRTGKTLSHATIDQLEATEAKKVSEVVAVRLDNIKLRNKLKRHEQLLRQKVFYSSASLDCFDVLINLFSTKTGGARGWSPFDRL